MERGRGPHVAMMPHSARSLAGLLEQSTGQQLATGRRWRIETVLQPVMREHGLVSLDMLAAHASKPSAKLLRHQVVEALLNHETSFFRDYALFRTLADEALPCMAKARDGRKRALRVWSAGCSTGQEAYSMAMLFAADWARWDGWSIEILGTDVSARAIEQAREGVYSQFEVQRGLPIGDLIRRFDSDGSAWRVQRGLLPWPTFAVHNLLDPPPSPQFDVILCRNVLLYFAADRRRVVLDRLASAIAPGGLLMLGAGETVLGQTDAFRPDDTLRGFYRAA